MRRCVGCGCLSVPVGRDSDGEPLPRLCDCEHCESCGDLGPVFVAPSDELAEEHGENTVMCAACWGENGAATPAADRCLRADAFAPRRGCGCAHCMTERRAEFQDEQHRSSEEALGPRRF